MLFVSLIYGPVSSLFPLMVDGHFGGTVWHASLVESLFAGGLLVSSLILGVWGGESSLAIPLGLFVAGPIAEFIGIARRFFISGILIMFSAGIGQILVRRVSEN